MDDNDFHRYPKNQHSGNSAAPLPAAAQYHEDRAGAPVVPESEDRQPEWPLHNPVTTSFSSRDEGDSSAQSIHPLPPVPQEITPIGIQAVHPDPRARQLSILRTTSIRPENGLDWIIPREENLEKTVRERTVGERLDPTLLTAIMKKDKYAFKARLTGYALNAAIGLQILFGTLTTGLAVVVSGHRAQVSTAVLGGFSTLVASFLARARGSNEPELSITRVKDLEQFIRECQAFKMDYGHIHGDKYDNELNRLRDRFEEIIGNSNGERKPSTPV